jgi:hypothetical protein
MGGRDRLEFAGGYSGENDQWHCRESGRRCAVKTATIPVKTARV